MILLIGAPYRRLGLVLHRILSHWRESRNNHRGYHPSLILYDLFSHWQPLPLRQTCPSLDLHPLEIPPTDLKEIGGVIRSSSHIAELLEKDGGLSHAPANVM